MNRKIVGYGMKWFWVCSVIYLSGCASYTDETSEIRRAYTTRSYHLALTKLDDSSIKSQSRNKLLFLMEKSIVLDRLGEYKKSRQTLLDADRTVDELYHASLLGSAASFVYNDSSTDYQGEDYEKVGIHTLLALNFLRDGDLMGARVEAKAINSRLDDINSFYKENKNHYKEDAFARYLSGLIYEAKGEYDDAIIDYRAALRVYTESYEKNFDTGVPPQLVMSLYRLAKLKNRSSLVSEIARAYPTLAKEAGDAKGDFGNVIVIHQVGLMAHKTTFDFVFGWDGKPMRMSFPVIARRRQGFGGRTGVEVPGQRFEHADMCENMDSIASVTLEDRRLRIMAKMAARLVLKDQMAQQARKNFGLLGELGASVYGAVSETADTRGWTLFPSMFSVTRLRLAPGDHNLTIYSDGIVGRIVKVHVERGGFYFFTDAD